LTAVGERYHGYKVIFRGDNSEPHQDAKVSERSRGILWQETELVFAQAAQMAHMNVLDLSVFPCMSRRHTEACRETGEFQGTP
jgi:hypothetical protein